MEELLKPSFRRAGSFESKGEVFSIALEDGAVIVSVKGQTGIHCDYHVTNIEGANLNVGDQIRFNVLPVNFDNLDVSDEDFCFPIAIIPSRECEVISFSGVAVLSTTPE